MLTIEQINVLRELLAKAAPGNWITDYEENAARVAFSHALHNAAPELLATAEEAVRLRELVNALREALEIANIAIDGMWPNTKGQIVRALALASKEVA